MYEKFTNRARKVFLLANQEAIHFNHEYIGTEHILLGLIKEGSGIAANVLKNLDLDLRKLRDKIEERSMRGPDEILTSKLPQTPRAKKVVEGAIEAARERHHNYVGTEHILIGLLREEEGIAAQVLNDFGVVEEALKDVDNLLGIELPECPIDVLERQRDDAIANQDFEKASQFRDQLDAIQRKERGDHQALLEIAHVLFSYVGAQNAREALTSIYEIAGKALES